MIACGNGLTLKARAAALCPQTTRYNRNTSKLTANSSRSTTLGGFGGCNSQVGNKALHLQAVEFHLLVFHDAFIFRFKHAMLRAIAVQPHGTDWPVGF